MASSGPDVEKGIESSVSAIRPYAFLTNHRRRHFIAHDGRRVHIASSPQEEETLRQQLSRDDDYGFDLYLHGSPGHLDALRKTHNHHEQRREALRAQHSDVYDEFHNVHSELDWLASELEKVAKNGVRLDASFSKYGYSAHLRE